MKIYACPRCGSKEIFMGTIDSGVLIGMTSTKNVCKNCGFQGNPILFDSEQEYQHFLKEIKQETTKTTKEQEVTTNKNELSEKDKLVLDFIKDIKKEKTQDQQHKDQDVGKNWWPEIVIALFISVISGIWIYPNLLTVMIDPYVTIYLIGYIIITFLITIIIILVIEYILKSLINRIIHLGKKSEK